MEKLKDVYYIAGYMEALALSSADSAFEVPHLEKVVQWTRSLAKEQNLNMEVATAIAYLHDIGRLKANVEGKKHGKEGAKIAKKLLKHSVFDEQEQKTIVRAIKKHSKKDKVHDVYDELIKEADRKAHAEMGL